jgi:hypothetical protein
MDSGTYLYSQKCPDCGYEKPAIQDMTSIGEMDLHYSYDHHMGEHVHNSVTILTEYICGNPDCQHAFHVTTHPRCRNMKCTYGVSGIDRFM